MLTGANNKRVEKTISGLVSLPTEGTFKYLLNAFNTRFSLSHSVTLLAQATGFDVKLSFAKTFLECCGNFTGDVNITNYSGHLPLPFGFFLKAACRHYKTEKVTVRHVNVDPSTGHFELRLPPLGQYDCTLEAGNHIWIPYSETATLTSTPALQISGIAGLMYESDHFTTGCGRHFDLLPNEHRWAFQLIVLRGNVKNIDWVLRRLSDYSIVLSTKSVLDVYYYVPDVEVSMIGASSELTTPSLARKV
uniref:BclA_C domain-containing protein n=1 Tax=Mesocestoides corti TaxID=53468 RepID=A0A5K3FB66_MESCO